MTFSGILFYIFSAILLVAAVNVVTAKNPVHAVLWLVLAFWNSACLWMLLQAEFLGIILVVVYVGAVMVLFLFVVMMINVDLEVLRAGFWRNLPVSFTVGVLMAVTLILVLVNPETRLDAFGRLAYRDADYNSIRAIGEVLYTDYLLPFELAAVLLLLGMVAAIALVHRKTVNPKRMDPADQVSVDPKDRLRVIKMQAVVPETLPEENPAEEGGAAKGEQA